MAIRRKTNNTTTAADLRTQRDELVTRLAATEAQARDLDPLEDWERLSALATEAIALERAVAAADARIAEAERNEAAAAREARDAQRSQRAVDARANLEAVARKVCDELQRLDTGLLADFDAALRELGAVGGFPTAPIGPALSVRKAASVALDRWHTVAPTWVGLPEPPSRYEQALAERRQRVIDAEERLEDARTQAKKANGRHGNSGDWRRVIESHAYGLQAARMQLLQLESPDLDPDEVFKRSTAGLGNELANYIGRYWEGRRAEEFRKQQEAEAKAEREAVALAAA